MKRKKILLMTDFALDKTGFARFAKALLEYLWSLNKYEIVHLCVGKVQGTEELKRTPWKSIGTVNPQKIQELKQSQDPRGWESLERLAGYGAYALDEVVRQEKPDAVFLAQDIWGINFGTSFDWFKKIPTVFWTTLDSRPMLPTTIEVAKVADHLWSWADFATKDMHQLGYKQVKTVPGCINTSKFYPLSDKEKLEVRQKAGIGANDFIIGMVARNQLRKGFPNLIEGYSIFKKENPEIKNTKLFFHTSWAEGWNIHKFCDQFGVNKNEVVTTYICPHCFNYEIKPFTGHNLDCKFCGVKGTPPNPQSGGTGQVTTHPTIGVTEKQLNEIYNIINAYIHPATSGGLEIPLIENMLASNAPTATTNYSSGEDYCEDPNSGVFTLDWDKYLEGTGTDFIKAWTKPYSIAKTIKKIYNLDKEEKQTLTKKGREWCLNRFSAKRIGTIVSDLVDTTPFAKDEFFERKELVKNPNYVPSENPNDEEWLHECYVNFFGREPDAGGKDTWLGILKQIPQGSEKLRKKQELANHFRQVAIKELSDQKKVTFEDFLNKKDKGRVLFVLPESHGDIFLATSLFKSIKSRYPDWALYVSTKPEYKEVLEGNPYMDNWIPYSPLMDNIPFLEGNAQNKGYFDVVYPVYWQTQRMISPAHNGNDKLDFQIYN